MLDLVRFEATVVEETVRAPRLVRFGTFEVDLRAGELRKDGAKLKLTGQPFQVLTILLEQPGEVVTREELQKRLWPDTFVDVDHNLNSAINKIREVLGDSAESSALCGNLASAWLPLHSARKWWGPFLRPTRRRSSIYPIEDQRKASVLRASNTRCGCGNGWRVGPLEDGFPNSRSAKSPAFHTADQ